MTPQPDTQITEGQKRKAALDKKNKEAEEERLKQLQIAEQNEELLKKKKNQFVPAPSSDLDDWEKVIADYRQKYNKEPAENKSLSFDSREEAISFFADQAAKGRQFLCVEMVDGKLSDFYVFSCGNNKLYQGSLADIQKALQKDQATSPNDANIQRGLETITAQIKAQASNMKSAMNDVRQGQQPEAADQQQEKKNDVPRLMG